MTSFIRPRFEPGGSLPLWKGLPGEIFYFSLKREPLPDLRGVRECFLRSSFANFRERGIKSGRFLADFRMGKPQSSNADVIKRLLALTWRYRWGCVKLLALQGVVLALGMAVVALTGLGIDELRHALEGGASPSAAWMKRLGLEGWSVYRTILGISAMVLVVAIVRAVLDFVFRFSSDRLMHGQLVVQLRGDIYDKLQRLSFRFYDAHASASIINRVTSDVQSVRMFLDQVLLQGIVVLLSLVAGMVYMGLLHGPLTLACLATTPLLLWVSMRFSRKVEPAYQANRVRVDAMVQRLAENIRGMSVVKAFAREEDERGRFEVANDAVCAQKLSIFGYVTTMVPMVGFLSQCNRVILLAYGGYLVIKGEFPLGTGLVAFATILSQFSTQISNIAVIADSLQESLAGARRVFEVLDTPEGVVSKPGAFAPERLEGHVVFDRVSFGYGGEPVLHDITLDARPGMCVAIFGATGSGKSALMSLVPRFYDPLSGRVLVDGRDGRDIDLNALRRNVGMVFQESFLFSNTIAANIAFGHPEATREAIERAAKVAAAHDFIMAMPQGYETVLGEGGAGLSGGQRQRLAIARALLLEPPILLLDDPTAALDAGTEHEIAEAMESAMRRRTTFIVAHRQSMLKRADLIIVLERGRIVQRGTHEELMRCPGLYAEAMLKMSEPEVPV